MARNIYIVSGDPIYLENLSRGIYNLAKPFSRNQDVTVRLSQIIRHPVNKQWAFKLDVEREWTVHRNADIPQFIERYVGLINDEDKRLMAEIVGRSKGRKIPLNSLIHRKMFYMKEKDMRSNGWFPKKVLPNLNEGRGRSNATTRD